MNYEPPQNELVCGKRYAIYGVGHEGVDIARIVFKVNSTITYVVDSDESKWGLDFFGCTIQSPQTLCENREKFDNIILASTLYYAQMKKTENALGFMDSELIMP